MQDTLQTHLQGPPPACSCFVPFFLRAARGRGVSRLDPRAALWAHRACEAPGSLPSLALHFLSTSPSSTSLCTCFSAHSFVHSLFCTSLSALTFLHITSGTHFSALHFLHSSARHLLHSLFCKGLHALTSLHITSGIHSAAHHFRHSLFCTSFLQSAAVRTPIACKFSHFSRRNARQEKGYVLYLF